MMRDDEFSQYLSARVDEVAPAIAVDVTRVVRERGTGRELAAVYVPTTPNPTSGYLEIVPVEKITPTDWTVDEAMAFIISGGAVSPDSIPFSVENASVEHAAAPK